MESIVQIKSGVSLEDRIATAVSTVRNLIRSGHTIVSTLSSGKDSTTTTLLCLEAIRQAAVAGERQARHFISSSSTSVENPEIENSLLTMHEDIQQWVETFGLPVDVRLVEPNAASRFVVNIVGRGSLPRFVENGSAHRTCTEDWKIKPQQRLAKQLRDEAMSQGFAETVTVLGTRLDESAVRGARMRRTENQAQTPTRNPAGFLTISLIADWTESDVWDFLVMFLETGAAPFPAYIQSGAIRRMLDMYRDGNEGTCGMFLADGMKSPCGSRFGCWTCTITGDKDKSMESMLNSNPKYEYMRGLSDFRNFLVATQWDMSRRELVGRTISDAGYLPVRPDLYNLQMRMDLLRYLLTLDEIERERAEELGEDMDAGLVAVTPENQRMRNPQFEQVTPADIALIDFNWGMHHYASEAFPAVRIWFEVKTLGRRYAIPKLKRADPVSIPGKAWFKVDKFNAQVPTDGLRDYKAEQWNRYQHPERPISYMEVNGERIVYHETADTLSVDAMEANIFVMMYCTTPLAIEAQYYPAIESTRFWLNKGIVKLPKGMAARYQHMAKRGQYFSHLQQRFNLTPAELDKYLRANSISDQAHNLLLGVSEAAAREAENKQLDFWAS